ncbi:MAG: TA system VapC family ribonuclease toxin [Candidatus Microthrix subdominans]|jgi:toxin-antitoxin system PIN domain toxin
MPSTTDALLLDANVLIAATIADHEHHERARQWLGDSRRFATCPSTQGSLVRYLVRVASAEHALDALRLLNESGRHEFWPDHLPYSDDVLLGVVGHRQVTDAYLAALAASRATRVATFDRGLTILRDQHTLLVP